MKCEICHKAAAETALKRVVNGEEEELYVCRACAANERKARQKKSQRTRNDMRSSEVSITVNGEGGVPPPIVGALLNALNGMVPDIEQICKSSKTEKEKSKAKYRYFPTGRVEAPYRLDGRLHLEGLHLIGELEAAKRAVRALRMELVGVDVDGVKSTGHVFRLRYQGSVERAKHVVSGLLDQERNARIRLFEQMPRVFGDSLCRALAILKNCRLLSPGELFDLLSPLRLGAMEKMLDGINLETIEKMMSEADLTNSEYTLSQNDRDALDAARADEVNARFEDVVLNERGEEKFL